MECFPLERAIFVPFHSGLVSVGFKRSEWFSEIFCHFKRDELNKVIV